MGSRLSVRQHARLTGFVLTLGAALAFPLATTAQPRPPETPRAAEVIQRVPLYFEPLPDGSFLARRIGRTIRITRANIHIAPTAPSGVESSAPIGIRFAGARRGLSVEGIAEQRGRVNYLLGNDAGKWRTNVRTYARARIRDLYPGIDVEYYGAGPHLEYDFTVQPGADPRRIRLAVSGLPRPTITATGDLVLSQQPEILQRKPFAFQTIAGTRHPVDARYVLRRDGTIGMTLGKYDRSQPLVIDPVLVYSFTFGGTAGEIAHDMKVDAAGAVYVAGSTTSTDMPVVKSVQPSRTGGMCGAPEGFPASACRDGFLMKLGANGTTLEFATYFGGDHHDFFTSITVDDRGFLYAIGSTLSENFPRTSQTECVPWFITHEAPCAVVVKIAPAAGTLVYSAVHGKPWYLGATRLGALAVAPDGSAYVIASVQDLGASTHGVARLSTNGAALQFVWTTTGSTAASRLAIDRFGNFLVAGTTSGNDFQTTVGAYQRGPGNHLIWSVGPGSVIEGSDEGLDDDIDVRQIAVSALNPSLMFTVGVRGLARSVDAGRHWTRVNVSAPSYEIVLDGSSASVVYLFDPTPSAKELHKSTDAGISFVTIALPGYPEKLVVDEDSGTLYLLASGLNYRSTDGGASWTLRDWPSGTRLAGMDTNEPARIYAKNAMGMLVRTADEGVTWEELASGELIAIAPSDPHTLYVADSTGVLRKTTDDGATWETVLTRADAGGHAIVFGSIHVSNPQQVILLTDGDGLAVAPHALRTDDGGETWTALPIQFASAAALDPNDPQRTIVGKARTYDAFLMRLRASGEVLYAARIGGEDIETITSLAVDPSGAAYAAGATRSLDFPFDHLSAARPMDSSLQAFLLKLLPDGASAAFVKGIGPAYSLDRQLEPVLVQRDALNRSHATVCRRFGPPPVPCSTIAVDGSGTVVQSFSNAPGWLFATDPDGSEYFVSPSGAPGAGQLVITKYTWLRVASLAANMPLPARFNTPITWTAAAVPKNGVEYSFWRFDAGTGWAEVQPYGPGATYTWTPAYNDIGTHALQVWARPAGSTERLEAWAATEFTVTAGPLPTVTGLSPSAALPAPMGTPLTWTATATGGVSPLHYKFWRHDPDGWHMVQDYGPSNTYQWTPAAADSSHALQVWVRNADSLASYESYRGVTFAVRGADPVTVTGLVANSPFPSPAGRSLVFTATAMGGLAPLEYRFWRLDAAGWQMVQDYGPANTYAWTPGLAHVGPHALQVWVRSAGSGATYEAWKGVAFDISPPPPVTVTSLASSVPLPVSVGAPITWTATAVGGVAPLEYQFWRLDATGWQIVQPYGPSSTYTWTPLPGDEGSHALQVWVRSAGSSAPWEGWRGTGGFTITP